MEHSTAILSKPIGSVGQRNMGIELLRCCTMLMIVMLHIFNQGGAARTVDGFASLDYHIKYPFRVLCSCSVNIYAMISGYVMLSARFKPERLLGLWVQTVFIGLIMNAVGVIIKSDAVDVKTWIQAAFPLTQREYWYFSAYAGVFLLSPLINRGINSLSQSKTSMLLLAVFALFSIGSCLGYSYNGDPFSIVSGYSVLWLLVLYVLGACLKKNEFLSGVKTRFLILTLVLSIAMSCAVTALFSVLPETELIKNLSKLAMSYVNPLLVIDSVCMLLLFSRIKVKSNAVTGCIRFFAPLTFGVYLIHLQPIIWVSLKGAFEFVSRLQPLFVMPVIIGGALLIYVGCSLADWLRLLLFKLCRIQIFCELMIHKLKAMADKITRKRMTTDK